MRLYFVVFGLLFLMDCGGNAPSSACKYGEPVPIFSSGPAQISSHNFEKKGQKAVEELLFADRTRLEIFQSGCNEIRQEFRFNLPPIESDLPDSLWFNQATERMIFLGDLDEKYLSLSLTGGVIQQQKKEMQLGQFLEIDYDTYLMVDRIVEPQSTLLIVVMEKRS